MMKRNRRDIDRDTAIRRALERAAGGPAPDLDRLLARVPELLAEASRRRQAADVAGLLSAMVPLARRAIPRLAAATGVILLLAAATAWNRMPAREGSTASDASVLLGVSPSDAQDDPLLQAIVDAENSRE